MRSLRKCVVSGQAVASGAWDRQAVILAVGYIHPVEDRALENGRPSVKGLKLANLFHMAHEMHLRGFCPAEPDVP